MTRSRFSNTPKQAFIMEIDKQVKKTFNQYSSDGSFGQMHRYKGIQLKAVFKNKIKMQKYKDMICERVTDGKITIDGIDQKLAVELRNVTSTSVGGHSARSYQLFVYIKWSNNKHLNYAVCHINSLIENYEKYAYSNNYESKNGKPESKNRFCTLM